MDRSRPPVIVAHKVNRYPLLRRYLAMRIPILEIDVSVHNGHLVVQHGMDFSNVGHVRGEIMRIGYLLMEHRDPLWRPMLLDEYLREVGGRAGIWLDLKCCGVEDEIVRIVRRYRVSPVVVSSPYHESLKSIKELDPSITTMLGNIICKPVDPIGMIRATRADGISIEHKYIDRAFVECVHKAGLRVAAWTVNDVARARELIGMGCDYIITNVPEKIIGLVRR